MYEFFSPEKIIIYNFIDDELNNNKLLTINFFKLLSSKISLDGIKNAINRFNTNIKTKNINEKNVFNTIFDIEEKAIWLQKRTEKTGLLMKNFVKVGFDTVDNIKNNNEYNIEKDNLDNEAF